MSVRYLTRPRGRPAPSPDQLKEQGLIDAAAEHAIEMIKPWVKANPARLLKSLTKQELNDLCWAVISKWIAERSKLEDEMPNDSIDDLWR